MTAWSPICKINVWQIVGLSCKACRNFAVLGTLCAFMLTMSQARSAEEVDLELVLAMDGSGSISEAEYILQLAGTAAALRDPSIGQSILSGPLGRIAISVVIWSDAAFQKFDSGWFVLSDDASIDGFAHRVLNFHKHTGRKFGIGGGGTGIGEGVRYAIESIQSNNYNGLRKTIDVSGDGIETDPWFREAMMMPDAKVLAAANGVTINGLAILTDFPELDQWYRENVIIGPGSFVIKADDFEDFAQAIRAKLWREISYSISCHECGPSGVSRVARSVDAFSHEAVTR